MRIAKNSRSDGFIDSVFLGSGRVVDLHNRILRGLARPLLDSRMFTHPLYGRIFLAAGISSLAHIKGPASRGPTFPSSVAWKVMCHLIQVVKQYANC